MRPTATKPGCSDAMQTLTRLNPLLGLTLSVESFRVKNIADSHPGRDGELSIESSDAASSWGVLPDLIIADELTHWPGDGTLWHSLVSSAAKRANCLFIVIANAELGKVHRGNGRVRERPDKPGLVLFSAGRAEGKLDNRKNLGGAKTLVARRRVSAACG